MDYNRLKLLAKGGIVRRRKGEKMTQQHMAVQRIPALLVARWRS